MLASTRPSARLRRAAGRGSVVGMGLLVATSAMTPTALADPGTTEANEPAPETGQDVDVEEAPAPLNPVPATDGAEVEESPEAEAPAPGDTVEEAGVDAETPVDEAGDVVVESEDVPLLAAEYADFGSGKDFGIQVQPSDLIPEDLDLSGATFAVTRVGEETPAGICTTDGYGSCGIGWDGNPFAGLVSDLVLPAGDYEIRQTSASAGLAGPADALGVIHVCSCLDPDRSVPVPNASLFRTQVITTVVDADDASPLRGASYTLTGPAYPHLDWRDGEEDPEIPFPGFPFPGFPGIPLGGMTAPAAAPAAVDDGFFDAGTATTGADGTATHEGWFLPGEGYSLTPVTAPAGYAPDNAYDFTVGSPAADSGTPWAITRQLTPSDSGTDSGGTPAPNPRPRPVPAPAAAPAPVVVPDAAPAGLGPAPAPVAPAAAEEAAPSPTAAPSSTPATAPQPPSTDRGGDSPVFSGGETPELETVASDLPDAGWVAAFGGMFLAVVLVAFALVRRRARHHG